MQATLMHGTIQYIEVVQKSWEKDVRPLIENKPHLYRFQELAIYLGYFQ